MGRGGREGRGEEGRGEGEKGRSSPNVRDALTPLPELMGPPSSGATEKN